MAKAKTDSTENVVSGSGSGSVTGSELADALVLAINAAKPPQKKTVADRKVQTPWTPPPGVAKLKLKRKIFQHGLPISEDFMTNEQIALCNKIRPGTYCDGWVKVIRRHDRGLNIDYPVRTGQQRLKLVSVYGIRNFDELLQRLIREAEMPKKSEFDVSDDE